MGGHRAYHPKYVVAAEAAKVLVAWAQQVQAPPRLVAAWWPAVESKRHAVSAAHCAVDAGMPRGCFLSRDLRRRAANKRKESCEESLKDV